MIYFIQPGDTPEYLEELRKRGFFPVQINVDEEFEKAHENTVITAVSFDATDPRNYLNPGSAPAHLTTDTSTDPNNFADGPTKQITSIDSTKVDLSNASVTINTTTADKNNLPTGDVIDDEEKAFLNKILESAKIPAAQADNNISVVTVLPSSNEKSYIVICDNDPSKSYKLYRVSDYINPETGRLEDIPIPSIVFDATDDSSQNNYLDGPTYTVYPSYEDITLKPYTLVPDENVDDPSKIVYKLVPIESDDDTAKSNYLEGPSNNAPLNDVTFKECRLVPDEEASDPTKTVYKLVPIDADNDSAKNNYLDGPTYTVNWPVSTDTTPQVYKLVLVDGEPLKLVPLVDADTTVTQDIEPGAISVQIDPEPETLSKLLQDVKFIGTYRTHAPGGVNYVTVTEDGETIVEFVPWEDMVQPDVYTTPNSPYTMTYYQFITLYSSAKSKITGTPSSARVVTYLAQHWWSLAHELNEILNSVPHGLLPLPVRKSEYKEPTISSLTAEESHALYQDFMTYIDTHKSEVEIYSIPPSTFIPHPLLLDLTPPTDINSVTFIETLDAETETVTSVQVACAEDGGWRTIGTLNNPDGIDWKYQAGNLTGSGTASVVWHAQELGALGVWTDGTDNWTAVDGWFDTNWTMLGCGDFDGDGKDSVLMSLNGGLFYSVDLDGTLASLGGLNWSGWEFGAVGDFAGDGKDDIVLLHRESGTVVLLADGNADAFERLGQLDATDWSVAGAGDFDADGNDDLLVRQNSTGIAGAYASADMSKWSTVSSDYLLA
ncbi:MAG: VCBS repeat-containing protein [Lentisphaeria bacterium]|nr:VCBS repeat-containing protein [Lentisphaeria bacterium]